jgi:siroheme synthase
LKCTDIDVNEKLGTSTYAHDFAANMKLLIEKGQPGTCFSRRQIELLLENGAKKAFSAYPGINSDTSAPYLHRIPLDTRNNTRSIIWFNILRRFK